MGRSRKQRVFSDCLYFKKLTIRILRIYQVPFMPMLNFLRSEHILTASSSFQSLVWPRGECGRPPTLIFFSFLRFCFFKDFIYLFLEKGTEGEREGKIHVWLPLLRPLLGTWPTTQACALTRNRTGDPLVHRTALNPLSHTSQDSSVCL